jgi:hypothetical protein
MSIRNNEDRVKHLAHQDPPPAEEAAPTVGLNFVIPTEFVDLPSRGLFYPEDHPLHGQDTIEVRHMTAKDEEVLTSRTLLKKGIAIDRVIQNVIVDKRVKVNSLLVGDKNAILVYSRIFAYGPDYTTKIGCPSCGEASEYTFNLLEHVNTHPADIESPEAEGFKVLEGGNFAIYLPKTKVTAEVRLLKSEDETALVRLAENKKKRRAPVPDASLIDQMLLFVVSLNGVQGKVEMRMFLEGMPAADSRHLRNVYQKLTPNLDLTQEYGCVECGQTTFMEVPFTPEFFWPRQ